MRVMAGLVSLVARVPARVQVKLLAAFLAIAILLIMVGAVGLQVLRGVNERTEQLIGLQRKIEAYRQVQHDTISQLYSVSSALLSSNEPTLSSALRQLNQFGYDVDRLQFVAKDEVELLGQFRQDYNRFVEIVVHGVEMIRAGRAAEAREIQATQAAPLADRLGRLTNQLVNKAEADMVAGIETSRQAYENSQWIVIAFALGSIMLALALGYTISWSLIGPVKQIEAQLNQVAAGHFTHRVDVINRDELGALGADVNKMSEKLGRLYQQLRQRTDDLTESLDQQTATEEILSSISRSITDTKPVFDAIVRNLLRLFGTRFAAITLLQDGLIHMPAVAGEPGFERLTERFPRPLDHSSVVGQAMLLKETVQFAPVVDNPAVSSFGQQNARDFGYNSLIFTPMIRDDTVIGAIGTAHRESKPFSDKQVALLRAFAAQAVIAIENTRLLSELRESLQQQTATSDVLKVISRSTFDLQTVLDTLVESAARLCDADVATARRIKGSIYEYAASYGLTPERQAHMKKVKFQPGRGSVTGRTLSDGKIVHVHDIRSDPEYTETAVVEIIGARTALGVPLLREGVPDRRVRPHATHGPSFHQQADRTDYDIRRSGSNRDREHPAVRGGAAAHAGANRIAGTADGYVKSARCYEPLSIRSPCDI